MPRRIEDTLLVTAPFKHDGTEYVRGDRVPVRHRAIRRIAAASPQFFAMEYETEDLDLGWLAGLEVEAEGRYEASLRRREEEKVQAKRALRDELKTQEQGQPDLEKRYAKQEKEEEKRKQALREEREREQLESEVAFADDYRSGFNY
jgi:hypothetical protein